MIAKVHSNFFLFLFKGRWSNLVSRYKYIIYICKNELADEYFSVSAYQLFNNEYSYCLAEQH